MTADHHRWRAGRHRWQEGQPHSCRGILAITQAQYQYGQCVDGRKRESILEAQNTPSNQDTNAYKEQRHQIQPARHL